MYDLQTGSAVVATLFCSADWDAFSYGKVWEHDVSEPTKANDDNYGTYSEG